MSSDPLGEVELKDVDEKPQQFRLIHLMALMSGVAFVCALAAPLYRLMEPGRQTQFVIAMVAQLLIAAGTAVFYSYRRAAVLKLTGKQIGIGYSGKLPGKYGPMILSSFGLLTFAMIQLGIAVVVVTAPADGMHAMYFVQQIQLSFFAGSSLMQIVWGRSPGTTEFFENGAVIGIFYFVPWDHITLRPSQFDENRIVMVNHSKQQSSNQVFSFTSTLVVMEPTRSQLLARYGEKAESKRTHPKG